MAGKRRYSGESSKAFKKRSRKKGKARKRANKAAKKRYGSTNKIIKSTGRKRNRRE